MAWTIDLVSENTALVAGQSASLGLRITHQPHWHTYWINPGDSGLAMKLAWHLPADFATGDIQWPAPKRYLVDGLNNFGYDGAVQFVERTFDAGGKQVGEVDFRFALAA